MLTSARSRIGARPARTQAAAHPFGCRCELCAVAADHAVFPRADLNHAEWEYLRQLLAGRSGSRCEVCGVPFGAGAADASVHHRRSRNMGGTDDPCIHGLANLVLVCGGRLAGVQGCHGRLESYRQAARHDRGLLVPWGAYTPGQVPPEVAVPIVLWSGRRVLLDPIAQTYGSPPGGEWGR